MRSPVLAVAFPRENWKRAEAAVWLKRYGYDTGIAEHTDAYWRFVQGRPGADPDEVFASFETEEVATPLGPVFYVRGVIESPREFPGPPEPKADPLLKRELLRYMETAPRDPFYPEDVSSLFGTSWDVADDTLRVLWGENSIHPAPRAGVSFPMGFLFGPRPAGPGLAVSQDLPRTLPELREFARQLAAQYPDRQKQIAEWYDLALEERDEGKNEREAAERGAADMLTEATGGTRENPPKSGRGSYPWSQCVADQRARYGSLETARKVCGSIREKSIARHGNPCGETGELRDGLEWSELDEAARENGS